MTTSALPPAAEPVIAFGSPRARWVVAATVLGSGLAFIDATVVSVALPSIGDSLGAGLSSLTWVINAYTLTLTSMTRATAGGCRRSGAAARRAGSSTTRRSPTPPGTGASARVAPPRERPRRRLRPRVEVRELPSAHAVRRRRRGLDDADPREDAEDRPDLVVVGAGGGELLERQVVPPVDHVAEQPPGHLRDDVVGELAALDEEHVQALVAPLGEQQAARRAAVAARAAGLLVVRLDRPGHRLVKTHYGDDGVPVQVPVKTDWRVI